MNTYDPHSDRALQDWSQEHFRLTYGQFATAVALVVGFRLYGLPILRKAIEEVLRSETAAEPEQERQAG